MKMHRYYTRTIALKRRPVYPTADLDPVWDSCWGQTTNILEEWIV